MYMLKTFLKYILIDEAINALFNNLITNCRVVPSNTRCNLYPGLLDVPAEGDVYFDEESNTFFLYPDDDDISVYMYDTQYKQWMNIMDGYPDISDDNNEIAEFLDDMKHKLYEDES